MRDDFTSRTIDDMARRVGYRCSNPECQRATVGSNAAHDGAVNIGVAAHITAASTGGPRFDPALDTDARRHESNGIWLCQDCAKLVDSDIAFFTVERVRGWKRDAQARAFRDIVAPRSGPSPQTAPTLTSAGEEAAESIVANLRAAAQADLDGFKRALGWPSHTVALNLRMLGQSSGLSFTIAKLPDGMDILPEVTIVAPPGTGKTTTLLQLGDALLASGRAIAVFIPLNEWSKAEPKPLLAGICARRRFQNRSEQELAVLADDGRLVLLLDGWNELDGDSQERLRAELRKLHRELPGLRVVISTRRQALDVPASGPVVEVDALSEDQQLDIARGQRGERGAALIDQARRTPGLRSLVSIPLYLNALLHGVSGETLPTTKEEVLRLFVNQHERAEEHAYSLRTSLLNCHTQILTALAVGATTTANTAMSDSYARSVVSAEERRLETDGQMRNVPEPATVLDILVSHHTLMRAGADGRNVSFHHQQLQEWYASFEVEKVLFAAVQGDKTAYRRLRVEILNERPWEEAILFACERISRADDAGGAAVATLVNLALAIDPMLAAEMIHRSAPGVWDGAKGNVLAFTNRWHVADKEDRAIRFMIMTGRAEFAPVIWPLVTSPDDQIQLGALRAAPRFRPSVLGFDLATRVAEVPDKIREILLAEIALESGFDGLDLATELAKGDQSPAVQTAVAEALLFRRAERHASELLSTASEEVWAKLARKWRAEEVDDAALAARLRAARQRQFETEANPLARLSLLTESSEDDAAAKEKVAEILTAEDFPWRDQYAASAINQTSRRFPGEVATGLLHRLAAGLEIPYHAERLLAGTEAVDEGPLAAIALDRGTGRQVGHAAACVIGPNTAGAMIDTYIGLDGVFFPALGQTDRDYANDLRNRLSATRPASFIPALLARGNVDEPRKIVLVADLLAYYGNHDAQNEPVALHDTDRQPVIGMVRGWVDALLASPDATHDQLGTVARAIGRLGRPQLVEDLKRLLIEDLSRCRQARPGFPDRRVPNAFAVLSNAPVSHMLPYRTAFAAIGGDEAAEAVRGLLDDLDFGFDAACVLKAVWDSRNKVPKPNLFRAWPDLSGVREARARRNDLTVTASASPFAAWIFDAIARLSQPGGDAETQSLALLLGRIAVLIPHGDRSAAIVSLLALPQPIGAKRCLLAALVLAGEVISADLVLAGIEDWVKAARQKSWLHDASFMEAEYWLELLPFSDRPAETLEGIRLVSTLLHAPRRMERVVAALGYAPGDEAEGELVEMARQKLHLFIRHEWFNAMAGRGTASAALAILDSVTDGGLTGGPGAVDMWEISGSLAALARAEPALKAELLSRYQRGADGPCQQVLERVLAETGDSACLLALARSYAQSGRPFDGTLARAIDETVVERRPLNESSGAFKFHPVARTELRKDLFAMLGGTPEAAAVSEACLTAIDRLRDEYGAPEFECRHPHIETGRPWPLAAGSAAQSRDGRAPSVSGDEAPSSKRNSQSSLGKGMEPMWLRRPRNGATIIFVHGILSGPISAWRSQNGAFWPRLVIEDQRLSDFGVYLFAYRADALSGTYSLEDAVDSMREHFRLDGVMSSDRLIFLCHSMGGILARRFVTANQLALAAQETKLAFFLVASPSLGSNYANFVAAVAPLYNAQLDILRFSQKNQWLNTLDNDFLNLKEGHQLSIVGKELVEDQFAARRSIVRLRQIVPPWTGARYFGYPIKIPRSDHTTIAKPTGLDDLQHRLLVEFIGSVCGEASTRPSINGHTLPDDRPVVDWGQFLENEISAKSPSTGRVRRMIVFATSRGAVVVLLLGLGWWWQQPVIGDVTLAFVNTTDEPFRISDQAEYYITAPEAPGLNVRVDSGVLRFVNESDLALNVPATTERAIKVRFINEDKIVKYYMRGDMYVTLIFSARPRPIRAEFNFDSKTFRSPVKFLISKGP